MTDHDPICERRLKEYGTYRCTCTEIRKARTDERERIVQDAEDFIAATYPVDPRGDGQILPEDVSRYHKWVGAKTVAARIAREGYNSDINS